MFSLRPTVLYSSAYSNAYLNIVSFLRSCSLRSLSLSSSLHILLYFSNYMRPINSRYTSMVLFSSNPDLLLFSSVVTSYFYIVHIRSMWSCPILVHMYTLYVLLLNLNTRPVLFRSYSSFHILLPILYASSVQR